MIVLPPGARLSHREAPPMIKQLINDEAGANALEYGLVAGLVSVAIIVALTALGTSLDDLFATIRSTISGA